MVNFFCDVAAIFFPVMQVVLLQVAEPLWHRKSWPHIGIKPGRRGLATGGRSGKLRGSSKNPPCFSLDLHHSSRVFLGAPGPQAFPSHGAYMIRVDARHRKRGRWIHPFLLLGPVRGFQV